MKTRNRIKLYDVKQYFIILTTFSLIGFSCHREVIDIDLKGMGSQIVIEGTITDKPGPYRVKVKISKTGDYFEPDVFPAISGANVVVSDDAGNSAVLQEIEVGIYSTNSLRGIPGRTYTLKVTIDRKEYTANSTMPKAIELNSIRCVKESENNPIYYLSCNFTDREGVEDYCHFKIYRNGNLLDEKYYLYRDNYTDGQQIVFEDFEAYFMLNDYIKVEFMTIDKATYEYLSLLFVEDEDIEADLPDFFSVTSYNPKTNINNNALGYFSAHTIRTYTYVVRE